MDIITAECFGRINAGESIVYIGRSYVNMA